MTYKEIKTGDLFIFNDIKSLPKRKTATGYIDLITGDTERDQDIPDAFLSDDGWEIISDEELSYWQNKLNIIFV